MAINDPFMDNNYLAYLLKYDSVHGRFPHDVQVVDDGIKVDGELVRVFHETDPTKIPWGKAGADYIAECTGVFLNEEKGALHQ
jgi:glyceraldehyde 3-phosphate dehydrogenase